MRGGRFDLLKTGAIGLECGKQQKISLAGFSKILSNFAARAAARGTLAVLHH
jgi:hypothetical protein